ncbi:hypothetical protein [Rhodanobacter sp. C01]|nr:hypothetical protein [Rhodanobacter sp. C01]
MNTPIATGGTGHIGGRETGARSMRSGRRDMLDAHAHAFRDSEPVEK